MRPTHCNEGAVWDEPRWHREHYKVVTDFGAVGDGVTDDTAAIQAAIDHHAGSRGDKHAGIVFFPAGTYRVTSPLLLWKGSHLLCHPEQKATLVLPAGTAGYHNPEQPRPMAPSSGFLPMRCSKARSPSTSGGHKRLKRVVRIIYTVKGRHHAIR